MSKNQIAKSPIYIVKRPAVNVIGCYEKKLSKYVRTPNIDRLAEEGMMFTNIFCTNAISSPSREVIITGKYSHINGDYWLNQKFDNTQPTIATILQANVYQTVSYGKWHLTLILKVFDDYKILEDRAIILIMNILK